MSPRAATRTRSTPSRARGPNVTAPPRIVIAAGGQAGQVGPAIAIADALRAEGAEVAFVGGQRAEAELVPKAGYELDTINVEGISRSNPLKAARAIGKAAAALTQARKLLKRRNADAVLGAGGYVAGPVGLAAVTQRIPLVLAEADSHLGLSNRLPRPSAGPVDPPARAERPPRLPGVPARRPRAAPLPRHRPPRSADGHRPRARPQAV